MAAILNGLNKFNLAIGKGVTAGKKAADKVLWGSVNETPAIPASGTPGPPKKTKVGSFIQSGLFNVLDALLEVDLCNIITYLISIGDNKLAKVKRSETPTKIEKALYDLQDAATLTRQAIDTFYATPGQIIRDLKNPPQQPTPAPGTTPETNQPPAQDLVGYDIQKYNFGIVGKYIKEVFSYAGSSLQLAQGAISGVNEITQEGLADPEVAAALRLIPGFNTQINALKDYLNVIDKYADFRSIPNQEFQDLLKKLDTIRSVCVTIENLSLAGALDLAQQFIGTDIRSQIAQLNQYLNPLKIIPTLKEINNSLRTFINTCKTIQTYIRIGRGVIKIAVILVRLYQFIAKLIASIPAPLMFATYDVTAKLENAKEAAKENSSALLKFLGQFNSLLGILLSVVRYLQQNTEALLQRVERLLSILNSCEALAGSDIVKQLNDTQADLIQTNKDLLQILTDYDTRQVDEAAPYKIVIVEEELVDEGIQNKRRRGIALGLNGIQVTQSDLTFATDENIIKQEVILKLRAMGLLDANASIIDQAILDALRYLNNDTMDTNELIVQTASGDSGLASYLQSIAGTSKFKAKTRTRLKNIASKAKSQVRSGG